MTCRRPPPFTGGSAPALVAAGALLVALAPATSRAGDPPPGAIVLGEPDDEHDAVVAVFSAGQQCSGTVVAVRGSQGYALTAAHCVDVDAPPTAVVEGRDYAAADRVVHPVTRFFRHPGFVPHETLPEYDFAVVQFGGASPSTPLLPVLTPAEDNLLPGARLEFVGYGVTEAGANSERRRVSASLLLATPTRLHYSTKDGGPCFGDSGGPALLELGGIEHVAGVTSFSVFGCEEPKDPTQSGASGRVSAVIEGFLRPILEAPTCGLDPGGACTTCLEHACCEEAVACHELDACRDDVGASASSIDPQRATLNACLARHCGEPCGAAWPDLSLEGAGCACRAGGDGAASRGAAGMLALLGALMRRRRSGARARRASRWRAGRHREAAA